MTTEDYPNIIDGIKSKRASVKIVQLDENQYAVEYKKYLFGFVVKRLIFEYDKLEKAEDKYIEIKENLIMGIKIEA